MDMDRGVRGDIARTARECAWIDRDYAAGGRVADETGVVHRGHAAAGDYLAAVQVVTVRG